MENTKLKNCLRLTIGNSSKINYLLKVVKKYLKMFNNVFDNNRMWLRLDPLFLELNKKKMSNKIYVFEKNIKIIIK